ncbi:MAG: choice-of-anchor J domain-containing protein [Prevotella sp.]|nr:choice-of-anchor J domain-containing protein [Prevotella sp.]MCM1075679.1 choice-of-anchor J domain-containing protein [Ruminococcus sp.]
MKKLLLSLAAGALALPALAHTDLLNQNFDNAWEKNYTTLELDHNAPAANINSLFTDSNGVSQPWWTGRDATGAADGYLMSHSYYQNGDKTSNDWLLFPAITIPGEGFNLTFGAQSAPIRSGDAHALSDLRVYITETPVTKDNLPTEPTLFVEDLGVGKSRDAVEKDFIPFTINLDKYVGKTIYISFANLNTDKDILAIDDVLVRRLDLGELNVSAPEYQLHGDFPVNVNIKGTDKEGLVNWKLTFKCGDIETVESGATLANGEAKDFEFTGKVGSNEVAAFTVTLSSDNNDDIVYTGTVNGMMFQTTKRILVEEDTFTTCGNCTKAISTIEAIEESEKYGDFILPVSIHCSTTDPMYNENYSYMIGLNNIAPMIRVDRADEAIGFNDQDLDLDIERENSAAQAILRHLDTVAICDVSVSGKFLKNAGKVSGIDATAELIPSVDMDGSKYLIGFILTENNVTAPEGSSSSAWRQDNYSAGIEEGLKVDNPWSKLPSKIKNMYYQDVAREIYEFHGLENSLPERTLIAGEKVTFNTQLGIPDLGNAARGTINPENLYLTVFVIEKGTQIPAILNANRCALGENPAHKVTGADMYAAYLAGVEGIEADFNGEAEYFNLQGIRVVEPTAGIYIVKRGSKVTKEVIK